jgi:hypothetical protein
MYFSDRAYHLAGAIYVSYNETIIILANNETKRRLLEARLERARHARQNKQQRRPDLFDQSRATVHNWRARVHGFPELFEKGGPWTGNTFSVDVVTKRSG